jgi:hypothetical protein
MVRITMGDNPLDEITGLLSGIPKYDLALGKGRPYALTVKTGASEFDFDLGSLPITRLEVRQGAGKFDVDFSSGNPQPMSLLSLGTGAGGVTIKNMANANAAEVSIEGGAAAYSFDFGGTLQRDTHARISTAVSSVEIAVPASTAAKIRSESVMASVDLGDGFTKKEGAYWTPAAMEGRSPVLSIATSVTLGTLRLRIT